MTNREANRTVLVVAACGVLFYLPFAARFFMGDDWLWMASGIRALDDPTLFLQRPIYGYFRPLALASVSAMVAIGGAAPLLFSGLNLLLHATNTLLLYRVLIVWGAKAKVSLLASFLFTFYYLNAPAVAWISTAPDLWVTALALLMLLLLPRQAKAPRPVTFVLICAAGAAAVLMKEAGLVTIGLYLVALLIFRKNPLARPHMWYTLIMMALYGVYVLSYFQTRTVVDKEIVLGPNILVHVWYFSAYLVLPLSKRIVTLVPDDVIWMLSLLKILVTMALPFVAWTMLRQGERWVRMFLGWILLFISIVSLFPWDISLFSLYPERTASRFMYLPGVGLAVLAAWLLVKTDRYLTLTVPLRRVGGALLILLYVGGNGLIVQKVTGLYRAGQGQQRQMYTTLVAAATDFGFTDMRVVIPSRAVVPQVVGKASFLQGMILVGTGKEVKVTLVESESELEIWEHTRAKPTLVWNVELEQLVVSSAARQ